MTGTIEQAELTVIAKAAANVVINMGDKQGGGNMAHSVKTLMGDKVLPKSLQDALMILAAKAGEKIPVSKAMASKPEKRGGTSVASSSAASAATAKRSKGPAKK